jgi:hypothetical protein
MNPRKAGKSMPRSRFLFSSLLGLVLLLLGGFPALGQDEGAPLVVFVLNPDIETASPFDSGPNGLSEFSRIFRDAGAQIQVVNLVEAVSTDADVMVMVGPRRRLTIFALARLWVHLSRGNHLLLAMDPSGYGDTSTETATTGLVRFLDNAYGLIPYDAFMAENWFTKDSILVLSGAFLRTHADVIPHPIVAPLSQFDLPVEVWAARPLVVEPIGVYSHAIPLLQTSTAYGETTPDVFSFAEDAPPLEMNLETDIIGNVNIAGLGENTFTGSHVVVLGDSEMLLNGYGLATQSGADLPRHIGNRIFAERLASWLIERPQDEWPSLPGGFTWIAVDGDSQDWDLSQPAAVEQLDFGPANYNIHQVYAAQDDTYLYILAQTISAPSPDIRVDLSVLSSNTPITISAAAGQVTLGSGEEATVISDAQLAVGSALEMRIPLRVLGNLQAITNFCAYPTIDAPAEEADCLDATVNVNQLDTQSPSDLHFSEGPLAVITGVRRVVLREGPDVLDREITTFNGGKVLQAVGRTEDGEWVQVQTGAFTGWVFSSLVVANTDIDALPVTQP